MRTPFCVRFLQLIFTPVNLQTAMADQHTVIQGSRRPDGTIRKEIRVRAGFRSEENTQVYKSRGTQVHPQFKSSLEIKQNFPLNILTEN